MKKTNLTVTMIAATLLLAACSGGGGSAGKSVEGAPILGGNDPGSNASPPPSGSYGGGGGTGTEPPPYVAPPPTSGGAVPASGSATVGAWSPTVMQWTDGSGKSVLPLHMALLADGRVMSYGTHDGTPDGSFQFLYDVWQPPVGTLNGPDAYSSHLTLPTGIDTHLFCSAQILIPTTGQLLINGGDNWNDTNQANENIGTTEISMYTPGTNVLTKAGNMNEPRWYGTPITLPNGEMYIQGGTDGRSVFGGGTPVVATHGEIRNPVTGQFRLLTGFNTAAFDNNYPRNFVAPDGKVFGYDHQQMYKIDPFANGGAGSMQVLYDDEWRHGWTGTSTAVMFRPGKILQIGGLGGWADDGRTPTIIDINGATPVLTNAARISQKRNWANSTVLPDGKVVLMGGSEVNVLDDQVNWTTGQIGYGVEIYDPVANTWTLGPTQQRMRLYHSVALLLPNGTVLSAAGGWPGPQLNRNAEVYYPPYLFKADGSWAARPTIGSAPTVANPSSSISITSPDAANIGRVTIVKTGSVTHSFNFEQRFIELAFTRTGNTLNLQLPANPYETPPGFYMIFVLDTNGVPSEAKIVRINPTP
ncbi:MAG: galactose oxidase-like domain-containing protein [Lautropia sp.]